MSFPIAATASAKTASNGATRRRNTAPHRKNAAQRNRSDSPYQQRTTQRDNPMQLFIKQAMDYLIQQLEAGKSDTLTAYLNAMARFHSYIFGKTSSILREFAVLSFASWARSRRDDNAQSSVWHVRPPIGPQHRIGLISLRAADAAVK